MAIELSSEHDVAVHSLSCDIGDLLVLELQKGIASASCGLGGSGHSQLGDLSELFKELLKLLLIETLGEMSNVDGALFAQVGLGDSELVESAGDLGTLGKCFVLLLYYLLYHFIYVYLIV